MNHLTTLKNLLWDTLTLDEQPDISLTQDMNVSISRALSKDGVNVMQIQSVVSKQIIINLVEALKIIDSMHDNSSEIEAMATKEMSWDAFQVAIKRKYLIEVLKQSPSITAAARKLDIERSYLSRLKRELDI